MVIIIYHFGSFQFILSWQTSLVLPPHPFLPATQDISAVVHHLRGSRWPGAATDHASWLSGGGGRSRPAFFWGQIGHPQKNIQNTKTFQLENLGNNQPGFLVFFWVRSEDAELEFGQHPDAAIRCVPRSPTSACETCATWLMRWSMVPSPLAQHGSPGHSTELQEFRREPDHGETVLQAPGLGGEGGISGSGSGYAGMFWWKWLDSGWTRDELGMNIVLTWRCCEDGGWLGDEGMRRSQNTAILHSNSFWTNGFWKVMAGLCWPS